ncbi:MAG: glycosyltransferase [bacterium]
MISTTPKVVFVVPSCNTCKRLGKKNPFSGAYQFKGNLERNQQALANKDPGGKILVVVNGTKPEYTELTRTAIESAGALMIESATFGSAGYPRYIGIDHAFTRLGADFVIMGDDDLHVAPGAIRKFVNKLDHGFDLVIGARYMRDQLGHPPWQFALEHALNLYASFRLGIYPEHRARFRSLSWVSFCTDFISGGQAFGRDGWLKFRQLVTPEMMEKRGPACTFFPGVYKLSLGLKIGTVLVRGRYDGDYFPDSFNPKQLTKRLRTIKQDFRDVEAAIDLAKKGGKINNESH